MLADGRFQLLGDLFQIGSAFYRSLRFGSELRAVLFKCQGIPDLRSHFLQGSVTLVMNIRYRNHKEIFIINGNDWRYRSFFILKSPFGDISGFFIIGNRFGSRKYPDSRVGIQIQFLNGRIEFIQLSFAFGYQFIGFSIIIGIRLFSGHRFFYQNRQLDFLQRLGRLAHLYDMQTVIGPYLKKVAGFGGKHLFESRNQIILGHPSQISRSGIRSRHIFDRRIFQGYLCEIGSFPDSLHQTVGLFLIIPL